MKKLVALFVCLALSPASAEEIAAADLPARLSADPPEIAVLGEVHDNAAHHHNQATAVAALRPRALVFEMLSPDQAARVTPDLRADPLALGKALGWEEAGWPDFALYAPIFAAAPDALIIGAALPRDEVRRAMSEPLDRVFGPDAPRYGLDQAYAPELQAQLEAEAQADHCDALPPEMLPGMVAAQRLRDGAFARTALRALKTTGGPVAVITGTGHARNDRAVPAMIAQANPGVRVRSLGQLEAEPGESLFPDQPYDWWIVTPPAPREDPCAAFRQ
ncbi:ChaN family lipoprotein [Sedimentimonas flavescens]|uniref:ChaN family lipoprotein n=1 Tax=Sedimentimonas flavescens TaxID=2851012 RepID=UPI001C4A2D45|nr:ChaN family lipoprotein [Sedimentimonas flavescens]MBW0156720.1 ChaN family lipoprotein [Sedimentimonas flavescens]